MAEKNTPIKKLTLRDSKHDMLAAYHELLKAHEEKSRAELHPEVQAEKKREKAAVETADSLSLEGVVKETANLRVEIGKMLSQLADSLQEEVQKYARVKDAVGVKEKELQEIYGIERVAQSLAALLDAQSKKKEEFEGDMARKKEAAEADLETLRADFEKERKEFERLSKEREIDDSRRRQREKEEYDYVFKREQTVARNTAEDEKVRQEKDLRLKKETLEKELQEREKRVAAEEKRLAELQKKVDGFPKEIDLAVQRAVTEAVEKVQLEAHNREELQKKTLEGEKNVLVAQIGALERLTKEQKEQTVRLSQQLEKAYQKVEDIAVKSVSGISEVKTLFQQRLDDASKRQGPEK